MRFFLYIFIPNSIIIPLISKSCSYVASQGNYEGLDTWSDAGRTLAKKAHIFPDDMVETNDEEKITNIYNHFGYSVNLYKTNKAQDNDYRAFIISYQFRDNYTDNDDYSTEICTELLTKNWNDAEINGIYIYANEDFYFKPPVSVVKAVDVCPLADPIIEFYFNIDTNSNYWRDINWQ